MDLKIKDVAELLNVSEKTVISWVSNKIIPSYKINQQYLFNRNEIEDWVFKQHGNTVNSLSDKYQLVEDPILKSMGIASGGIKQFSLYRALHKGDVLYNIPGNTKEEVIANASRQIAPLLNLDVEVLVDLLLERENLHSTSLGQGIALPHARELLLSNHQDIVVITFPEKSIDFAAIDKQRVHSLLFLFACDDRRHLNLVAKIAHLAHLPSTISLLKTQPKKEVILDYIKHWESNLPKN